MYRLLFNHNSDTWIFDENNWTYYLRELFLFFKNYFSLNADREIFFFLPEINFIDYIFVSLISIPISISELMSFTIESNTKSILILFSQITNYNNFIINLDINNNFVSANYFIMNLFIVLNFFMIVIFFFFIIFTFYLNFHNDYGSVLETFRTVYLMLYEEFILLWVRFASIKFESYEEALCILILWPWCIFLVFTHIFTAENNEIFFIFVEWGLPVVYGYLILIESLWLFGSYFFVYLNGARGRRLFLVTLLEDLIAFAILLARVTLQMVRGIICGLYHDFFRELTEYLIDTWESYWFYANWQLPFLKNYYSFDFVLFFIDWYIIAFILLFIYIILFLQLLFLVIAVWLFCRCWFISTKITINKFKFYNKTNRDLNLFGKNSTYVL